MKQIRQTPLQRPMSYEEFVRHLPFVPSPEQKAVITANEPALLVVAGAGSGKTATMSQRIAWHIACGHVLPSEVLGLTFTEKAAGELADRIRAILSLVLPNTDLERPTVATYDSFAANIASSYALLIGEDPRSSLITDAQRWQIMNQIVREWRLPADDVFPDDENHPFTQASPATIVEIALQLANSLNSHGVTIEQAREFMLAELQQLQAVTEFQSAHELSNKNGFKRTEIISGMSELRGSVKYARLRIAALAVVRKYYDFKRTHALVEFADQMAWANRILQAAPEIGAELRKRYKLIVLDEYQDTATSQAEFLTRAFRPPASAGAPKDALDASGAAYTTSICAVGDPNQAIYGWRGASAAALADFVRDFQVPATAQYTLATAYRNGTSILSAANALMKRERKIDEYALLRAEFPQASVLERPWLTRAAHEQNTAANEAYAVTELQPAAQAAAGAVVHIHRTLGEDTYSTIAKRIAQAFAQARAAYEQETAGAKSMSAAGSAPFIPPTAAVLVRKRAYAAPLIAALKEVGIPYDFVASTSVISFPEVQVVRAVLGAAVTPARGEQLLQVTNFYGIGASDLRALARVRRDLRAQRDQRVGIMEALAFLRQIEREQRNAAAPEASKTTAASETTEAAEVPKAPESAQASALAAAQTSVPASTYKAIRARFSAQGWERLIRIGELIARVRARADMPPGELVCYVINQLHLFEYAGARVSGGARLKRGLAQFIQLASEFRDVTDAENALHGGARRVQAFCEWLAASERHDRGADDDSSADSPALIAAGDIEPEAGVVQILTIHQAKGLEWDIVAVPAMVHGEFDAVYPGEAKPWQKKPKELPYPLRSDYAHLPQYSVAECVRSREISPEVVQEVGSRFYLFTHSALASYETEENMRLGYVALTRPRQLLLLATYDYKNAQKVAATCEKLQQKNPNLRQMLATGAQSANTQLKGWAPPASWDFVRDIIRAVPSPVVREDPDNDAPITAPLELLAWAKARGLGGGRSPLADLESIEEYLRSRSARDEHDARGKRGGGNKPLAQYPVWPTSIDRRLDVGRYDGTIVGDAAELTQRWQRSAQLLLAERHQPNIALPKLAYFSVTGIVQLRSDPVQYLLNRLRPIPSEPSLSARRGTRVHEAIAHYFNQPFTINIDAVAGENEMPIDADNQLTEERARELFERFKESRFAAYPILATEYAIDVAIGDYPIGGRIDAVFDTSQVPNEPQVTIVDWKTGRQPSGDELAAREFQLGLYRIAWAKLRGVPLSQVGACFYYLGEADPARRELAAKILSEEEILAAIQETRSAKIQLGNMQIDLGQLTSAS